MAMERGVSLRVLVLDLCTPEPDKDAGSITAFNIMRILQQLGCKVTFAPVDNYLFLDRYTTDLQRLGIECLYAPFVTSVEELSPATRRRVRPRPDLQVRGGEAAPGGPPAPGAAGENRAAHASDLHFLREQREADVRNDSRMRQRADRDQAGGARHHSSRWTAPSCTARSSRPCWRRNCPRARVTVFGWAIDVPGTTAPFESRRDVAFIGGYQHPPNVDGALFFAREILPLVQEQLPDVRFHVVGSNPPAELLALQGESIMVTGFVPDLGPLLDRMRLSVAPLRYGAGIKGKIGTSLSHGLPCVATPLAVEGMALKPDRDVLVATTPGGVRFGRRAGVHRRGIVGPAVRARHGVRPRALLPGWRGRAVRRAARLARAESARVGAGLTGPQRDGLEMAVLSSSAADRAYRRDARVRWLEREAIEAALIPPDASSVCRRWLLHRVPASALVCRRLRVFRCRRPRPSRPELARAPGMRVRPECANASRHSRPHHDRSRPASGRANLRDGADLAPLCVAP